jgi:peptidoglycan/xylan/chitin deacetylase (PgdA/CDA1 family)
MLKERSSRPRFFHVINPLDVAHGAILGSMFVLNFHSIGRPRRDIGDGEDRVCLERERFLEILDAVAGRDDVRLTFDDGNSSDVSEVLPELERRGLRAHFFVCPARFGVDGFVTEDEVLELKRAGMVLGSHGMDHVRWRGLREQDLAREIVEAKQRLQDVLGAPVDAAACPFGAYDRRTLRALRGAGFKRVYTSDGGRAHADDWLVARNTVRRWDTAESVLRMLTGSNGRPSRSQRAKRWIKKWR